jgi:hypothetical protein
MKILAMIGAVKKILYPQLHIITRKNAALTKKRVDGQFFLLASNSRPIYNISITSGFYLILFLTRSDPAYFNRKTKVGYIPFTLSII